MKKLVIGDRVGEVVNGIFHSDITPYGLDIFFGLVLYGIQLYCDFSGGMDIIRGVSECFGINLPINFRQPYFSDSLSEFWRRWHMTLGDWMKDYAFYPLLTSKMMTKARQKSKKVFSRKTANRMPVALGNLLVFILVGVWHGTESVFFAWGMYNGIILAASTLLVDRYAQIKTKLKITDETKWYKVFSVVRTFIIVSIGRIFDCTSTVSQSLKVFVRMFAVNKTTLGFLLDSSPLLWAFLFIPCLLLLYVDAQSFKGKNMRCELSKKPFWIQAAFWVILIQMIICFSLAASDGGFMYENF